MIFHLSPQWPFQFNKFNHKSQVLTSSFYISTFDLYTYASPELLRSQTWEGKLSENFLNHEKIIAFVLRFPSWTPVFSSRTRDGAQLVGYRAEGEAHSWCQIQLIPSNPGWRSETKPLQEGCEEEEDLHLSQTFSKARSTT